MPGTHENQRGNGTSTETAVCPTEEVLRVGSQTNVSCNVPGCGRVFAQSSARRFHMVKVHKVIENDGDVALGHRLPSGTAASGPTRYFCPVSGCKYTPTHGRFFTSMKNLNQHYRVVHAEKKFKCSRCGFGFGELRRQLRHEKSCGLKFLCKQCGNIYNNRDALQTHCSRTSHRTGFSSINSQILNNVTAVPLSILASGDAATTTSTPNQDQIPLGLATTTMSQELSRLRADAVVATSQQEQSPNTTGQHQQHAPQHQLQVQQQQHSELQQQQPGVQQQQQHIQQQHLQDVEVQQTESQCQQQLQVQQQPLELRQSTDSSSATITTVPDTMSNASTTHSQPGQPKVARIPPAQYILPKPDALYMPIQLQVGPANRPLYAGQSGPIVLIINNAPPAVGAPKRQKPLAPKIKEVASVASLRQLEGRGPEVGSSSRLIGREIEVQTDTMVDPRLFQPTVSTSELSVQTTFSPRPANISHMTHKDYMVAETQTMVCTNLPALIETMSKSSQVSPNAKSRGRLQDSSTGPMSEDMFSKPTKSKRRKLTETASQSCLHSDSKKGKRRQRRKIGKGLLTSPEKVNTTGRTVSAGVGEGPVIPQLESIGVGTMSSPLSLENLNLMNASVQSQTHFLSPHALSQPQMISVSTGMSAVNISVGTMPSPPLSSATSTIGTDPLPGEQHKDLNLSSVFSSTQETQTSFWDELVAENNATQTMESYLGGSCTNSVGVGDSEGDPLNVHHSLMMESGVQTCHAQNIHTQTWPQLDSTTDPLHYKSVGVGTSLLGDTSLFEGMETEGFSRSIGIDTQLFDDLFPEVSSRSVAISTPLLDNMESSQHGLENAVFRPIGVGAVGGQRSVGVSPLRQDLADDLQDCLPRSTSESQAVSCQTTSTSNINAPMLPYESIATASVQTDTDFELPVFLTAASQTRSSLNYDPATLTHMETQTVGDMFSQLLSNMETQTSSDILTQLHLTDIETQTPEASTTSLTNTLTSVETQTATPSTTEHRSLTTTTDTSPSVAAAGRMGVYIDTETQTLLPNLHLTENSLTDSHTQTKLGHFAALVDELEEN